MTRSNSRRREIISRWLAGHCWSNMLIREFEVTRGRLGVACPGTLRCFYSQSQTAFLSSSPFPSPRHFFHSFPFSFSLSPSRINKRAYRYTRRRTVRSSIITDKVLVESKGTRLPCQCGVDLRPTRIYDAIRTWGFR